MKRILLALICFAGLAAAADATGKWSGTFAITLDGELRDDTAFLNLKQEGTKITGEAGPRSDKAYPINSGSIEGNKIKFEVSRPDGQTLQFELTISGDQITGEAKAEHDGQKMSGKLNLKREK
jgi:hypothetical protein